MEVEIYKMIYNISKSIKDKDNLRIIGENFVINNKNKGNIIINNKKAKIKSNILINNLKQNKIKMVLSKNIYNISCIFKDCELLESLSYKNILLLNDNLDKKDDIQIIDSENIINFNNSIYESESYDDEDNYFSVSQLTKNEDKPDESILFIPNVNKRNINYFINMSYMFSNCNSLKYIPDISILKT